LIAHTIALYDLRMAVHNGVPLAPRMNAQNPHEKGVFRRWQRFRLNMPVRLIVTRDNSTRITEGRANDISDGGLLVFAGLELNTGDTVQFTPPFSGEAVRARGIVRHRRGYNYGVQFHGETETEDDQIRKFRSLLSMAAGSAAL
jgi:hypothetical protein